ncbi:helix-turn-helix transcriptional regulator [Coraliomargarita algicola]|uniref:Helix-turn-helix transcriptional regulator n=1 Tax=Coraliomargarita algicola TaxID=3092156 RepID=A0ABZ0RT38_9BACT|nr:helix-turn-helix transcriptional regulator [Coraliomargarita sp. J2-16]WPJ96139.1 helix-turn-helix transcriptional regulator [Coraliomargarita sp. J2-16]
MNWLQTLKAPPQIRQLTRGIHGHQVAKETYVLPQFWSLHFYEYYGRIDCVDQCYALEPGACSIVPPNIPITFHYQGPSEHLYCHFQLPENFAHETQASQFIHNDARLPQLKSLLVGAIPLIRSAPMRANLRLWEVLLGIQDILVNADNSPNNQRVVATACEIVTQEMGTSLTIHELAKRCQISHNQLTRIIKQETGETPAIWLRRMRTDRAKELLSYSDLPIKVIAAEVGYPDLQHFNKVIRQRFNLSPTQLRLQVAQV